MLNAFTVDVEDYFQVSGFEDHVDRRDWASYPSRVVDNTHRLLDLLDRHATRATFFVLGWTAHHYPELVAEIRRRGHELGSHSYWHRLIYRQTPDEFRRDLRDSIAAIQDAAGVRVTSYRAPSFSITVESQWALDVLAEEGITVDTSVFPIHHDRYGIPGSEPGIHSRCDRLVEFPPSVLSTPLANVPISGGGYFRLYPYRFTVRCVRRLHHAGQPYMFYIHPWEIDPDQPKLPSSSRLASWRHRVNLRTTARKLDRLLSEFQFGAIGEVLASICVNACTSRSLSSSQPPKVTL